MRRRRPSVAQEACTVGGELVAEVDDERRKQGVAQGGGGEAGDGTARACSARKESRVAAHTGRRERAAAVVVSGEQREVARSLGTRGSEQRAGHWARSGWGENERVRWEDLAAKKKDGGIFMQRGPAAGVWEKKTAKGGGLAG
jgi:hypothetical protein